MSDEIKQYKSEQANLQKKIADQVKDLEVKDYKQVNCQVNIKEMEGEIQQLQSENVKLKSYLAASIGQLENQSSSIKSMDEKFQQEASDHQNKVSNLNQEINTLKE